MRHTTDACYGKLNCSTCPGTARVPPVSPEPLPCECSCHEAKEATS